MSLKKQIFKINILKKLLSEVNSCVTLVPTTRLLALPPFFLNDMKSGILYLLNSILKKYDRTLDGIVIGYQNIKVLMDDNTGIIPMGAAETEVNVSVEFYIFQPKIGSHLEGVINKKSKNHIGCLVHRYFNATILKPEDVDYEDWACRDFNVDDRIIFKVKDLDFTGLLPYIEGTISEDVSDGVRCGKGDRSKVDDKYNMMVVDGNREETSSGDVEAVVSEEEEVSTKRETTLDANVTDSRQNEILCANETSVRKKKKKKKEKEKKEVEEELERLNKVQVELGGVEEPKERNHIEKKRKKKKKEKEKEKEKEENEVLPQIKMLKERSPLEKVAIQDKENNIKDFVECKKEKKKKRKKEDEEDSNPRIKETEKSSPREEDNMLFSTQLGTSSGSKKMRMSYLSPIPAETTAREEKDTMDLLNSLMNSIHEEINGSKKKKKRKKSEKRVKEEGEEEIESRVPPEEPKATPKTSKKIPKVEIVNGGGASEEEKSKVQPKSEKPRKEQTSRTKSKVKVKDSEGGGSIYERLMKEALSAISSGEEKKKRKKEKEEAKKRKREGAEEEGAPPPKKFRNGSIHDLDRTPEKRNPDKSLFSDSENHPSPGKRKKEVNGVTPEKHSREGKKSLVQTLLDEFMTTEGEKLKSESDRESGKESSERRMAKTKTKGKGKEKEKHEQEEEEATPKTDSVGFLYEKLLEEAKEKIKFSSPQVKKTGDDLRKKRVGDAHAKASL